MSAVPGSAEPPPQAYRVYLLDDHEVVRRGLRELLTDAGLDVVGDSGSVGAALAEMARLQPDVAVLDVRVGPDSGIEACRQLRSAQPEVRVLMITAYEDDVALFAAIMAGASGFVLKQLRGPQLVEAVRRVAAGDALLDPAVTAGVLERLRQRDEPPGELDGLTDRERAVLELIAEGLTNRQIAQQLFLAEKTVKNHVTSLLAKLGLQSRTQAAVLAAKLVTHPVSKSVGE